ncbi:hypothetical protein CKA32_002656 [Geitlerinema sp. FC II]|nr:hypothetical protein CKA32_006413 [Geitlerinema sp. FC II]PPT07336.1 hypothetical protein CKA32_002656 [Geitlerinema sp. FC II]
MRDLKTRDFSHPTGQLVTHLWSVNSEQSPVKTVTSHQSPVTSENS